jgi:hypothetical protein
MGFAGAYFASQPASAAIAAALSLSNSVALSLSNFVAAVFFAFLKSSAATFLRQIVGTTAATRWSASSCFAGPQASVMRSMNHEPRVSQQVYLTCFAYCLIGMRLAVVVADCIPIVQSGSAVVRTQLPPAALSRRRQDPLCGHAAMQPNLCHPFGPGDFCYTAETICPRGLAAAYAVGYCMLPVACCLLPIGYYLLPVACCLLPAAYCLLPIACCLILPRINMPVDIACWILPVACCLLPVAHWLLPIACCLLHVACCLLPAAYWILPVACCLLPAPHCLLPIAYCMLSLAA